MIFYQKLETFRLRWVLVLSGFMGFLLGAEAYPTWQHAVEGAQVVAGIVDHRLPSPFIMYQVNLWTISHQILAIFLKFGLSEHFLSWLVSGFLGMLSFQALALLAYAFSENSFFSVFFPVWVYYTNCIGFGVVYVIQLLGSVTTYGILGLGWAVLAIALLSLGKSKWGSFCLALAPAVHPSIGSYTLLISFFVFWAGWRNKKIRALLSFRFLLFGLGVLVLSFAHNRYLASALPNVPAEQSAPFLASFAKKWCGHRMSAPWEAHGFWIHLAAAAASAVALLPVYSSERPARSEFILRFCLISGIFGTLLFAASWIPHEKAPSWLLSVMPARLVDLNIFIYPAILFGWMMARRSGILLKTLGLGCLFAAAKLANFMNMNPSWMAYFLIFCPFLLFTFLKIKRINTKVESFLARPVSAATLLCFFLVTLKVISMIPEFSHELRKDFYKSEDAAFWKEVSNYKGMLLTSHNIGTAQIKTRRPILMEAVAIDGMPYAPASAPFLNQILKDLYAGDLLKNPLGEEALILEDKMAELWQKMPPAQWRKFADQYSFTQVLAAADWKLLLPPAAQNKNYVLYDIPKSA